MAYRIIIGTVLTMALVLSLNLAQAFPSEGISNWGEAVLVQGERPISLKTNAVERFCGNPGVTETLLLMKVNPRRNGDLGLKTSIPSTLASPLPRSCWQWTKLTLPEAGPGNRIAPAKAPHQVLAKAYSLVNSPYRRGSSLQTGSATDCSGFVQYIYKSMDIDLPRSSAEQARVGEVAAHTMDFSKLLAGDLLFFTNGGRGIGHVGIYSGEGKMIHAATQGRGVIVSDLREPYYRATFVVAKRLF